MDTREIAKEYRLSYWASIMQERILSGASIKAYCQTSGIRENVYYYWQRKLRETACQELTATVEADSQGTVPKGWATCEPAGDSVGSNGGVIIEIGKCRVTVTADTDPELLVKVCRTLTSIC